MIKRRKQTGKNLLAALLAAALLFSGVLPSMAASDFVFEDWKEKDTLEGERTEKTREAATGSELPATMSFALSASNGSSSLGDIWDGWDGDFSFLDGTVGDGSARHPYQIKNKSQMMGLSQLAAMGMRVRPGEGNSEIVGSYDGKYFKLMNNLDLGGMEWIPIGFYQDSSEFSGEIINKFFGHFDGNGKTVSNFRLSCAKWPNAGFFGAAEDAVIENLTLKPGRTITGKRGIGILVGNAVNSRLSDCTVNGSITAAGTAGGIAGEISGEDKTESVIENCTANITINVNGGSELYVGGISGKAAGTSIVDCRVETGDNNTARIQGNGATVGGITGFQNDTDIYNSYVSGTIGGAGTLTVGGITGNYASGHLKVARFEGRIGQSGTGAAGHRGTFIGNRDSGSYFRYGADVSYLFADTEGKIASDVCGSQVPDDNEYTYGAHVGYSHSGDPYYSLVQGGITKEVTNIRYYEELEKGILSIMDEDNKGAGADETGYEIDHFAPDDAGRPARGYLVTIPQIDTISSGTNYYDVAVLEVRGNSSYYQTLDKDHRGAVAPGKSVTVTTSPRNLADAKFQMDGVPTYTEGNREKNTTYVNGGEYTFTMPAENTEVKAVYQKVAVKVSTVPAISNISVVEERTGDRKNPVKTTKVMDNEGQLIASYINGELQKGTQIQPVNIQAVVDTNNDVADNSVQWSIDDPDLITLLANDDRDEMGYTKKSASIRVNLNASFFSDTIRKLEKEQADNHYRYPIPDTIFGAGHQNGGVAVLTASTRPAASFEGKPCTGNARINVTFQVKDKTYVANEGADLDKKNLFFTVTRKLTGSRKKPDESIQVTPSQNLTASFSPDFFDKKDINWAADDTFLADVDGNNKSASVSVKKDAKWIQDIIKTDEGIHENDPYVALTGSGRKDTRISVTADDMLGNRQAAGCDITIYFVTDDQTKVWAEGVTANPAALDFELICSKSGKRNSPVTIWSGNEKKQIKAEVIPEQAFNKNCQFTVRDDSLTVAKDGTVTVNTGAKWIEEVNKTYPYTGSHTAIIEVATEDGGFRTVCSVTMSYKLNDSTYSSESRGGGGGSSGGSGGSRGKSGGSFSGTGPGSIAYSKENEMAVNTPASDGSVAGTWVNTADGLWTFTSNKRAYHSEWAYVHNPYANDLQSSSDWFRFDENGHMMTGWFEDTDGSFYYLWPASDGTQGHMITGWQWIGSGDGLERRYYFNPESNGTRGALFRNRSLPDGSQVNDKGEWTVNGIVQVRALEKK